MLFRYKYRDKKTREVKIARVWWYEFSYDGGRIRESAKTSSKTVARLAEQQRRREVEEGGAGIRRFRPKLFRDAATRYLTKKKGTLSASSLRIEKKSLDHLLPFFGGKLSSCITVDDVARYQDERTEKKAAAGTINLEVATLRAVLGPRLWANLKEERVRMLPENDEAGRALDDGEEKRLLQQCAASRSRALYPAVVLALDTGLRYSELTGLRWRQVDLPASRLIVGKSKTKSGQGRLVPLTPRAAATFSLWASRFPSRSNDHFVFPSERYGADGAVYDSDPAKPIGRLKEAWEAAKRRTEDKDKGLAAVVCRWHDLRHSWVTRLLERGQSLAVVAQLAGWSASTAARMAKRYGHISEGVLRDAIAVLDRTPNPNASPEFHPESASALESLPS